jgi:DNA polymerase III gamma/tau subunit
MNSMPNPDQTDPHDVAVAALKQAREEIGRADRQLPRVDEQVSRLGPGAARKPSGQQERLAVLDRPSSRGRLALLGLIGLLLAACIGVAALAWQSPYGDAAKPMFARWEPQRDSTSSLPSEKQAQPSPPAVDVAATAALPQPAPLAQTTPQDVAPTAAPPELAQWLQTMARDLANVEQGIEQLKTSQEQMVRDNANLAEQLKAAQAQMARDNENAAAQLKASQEQIVRLIAKASEQNLRPKTSAPPPRPIATPARKPVPKLSSPQARARPLAPVPLEPKPPEQE